MWEEFGKAEFLMQVMSVEGHGLILDKEFWTEVHLVTRASVCYPDQCLGLLNFSETHQRTLNTD